MLFSGHKNITEKNYQESNKKFLTMRNFLLDSW
jgi:hypothetical protein